MQNWTNETVTHYRINEWNSKMLTATKTMLTQQDYADYANTMNTEHRTQLIEQNQTKQNWIKLY